VDDDGGRAGAGIEHDGPRRGPRGRAGGGSAARADAGARGPGRHAAAAGRDDAGVPAEDGGPHRRRRRGRGILALSQNASANSGHCGGSLGGANQCDATGVSLRSQAVGYGNVSTIAFIAGGVLAAGGATLWLVAPSGHVQVGPATGQNGGGVLVRGDF
jgi:hypothetical protein